VLVQLDPAMPVELQQGLIDIADVVSERAHDDAWTLAHKRQLDLFSGEEPVDLVAQAFRLYLDQPRLFQDTLARQHATRMERFAEFHPREVRDLPDLTDFRKERFRAYVAGFCAARNRTAYCAVQVVETGNEVQFHVVHGRPPRSQTIIEKGEKRSRYSYVPDRRDLLIFDRDGGRLAVSAQSPAEQEFYRETFGRVFFGAPGHFSALMDITARREGEDREAILAVGGAREGLPRLLEERSRLRIPTVVFVPSLAGLDGDLLARHPPGSLVVLVDLRELVAFEAGRLVRIPAQSGPQRLLSVREPPGSPYGSEPIVAEVFEASGKRGLSAAELAALVARRETLDLFIDATAPGTKRGCSVSVRDGRGRSSDVDLSAREVAALAELVRARRPLRVGEFRSVTLQSLDKLIERARRKLEGNSRQGQWRFFHTLSGVDPSAKSFLFKPQEGLAFAVILPLAPP
jgi:hypothetical protein